MSEPSLQDRFHLIGVGGAGMSVVAELLVSRGAVVAGSDREESQVLDHLRSVGVRVDVGHDASHVDPEAVVVVSSAIREDNPELAVARRRGQLVIHRSQALALAASGMRFVAVAGAHGKTSTSGMLAIALRACGLDPSVAVGGVLPQLGTGAHLGGGEVFVAEADESDGSFLNYSPAIEIVTNVEPDHLDRYHSREEFEEKLVAALEEAGVTLVVLAGFMRILSPYFVRKFCGRILNIHPSLLPSFGGAHAHRDVLAYGVKVSGCTIHFVDEGMDSGPIILQAAVPVMDDDTEDTLAARVLEQEHILYPRAIALYVDGRLKVEGRHVTILE